MKRWDCFSLFRTTTFRLFVVLACLLAAGIAEGTGSISGTVFGPGGSGASGVTVRAIQKPSNTTVTTTTNASGDFSFPSLNAPACYVLEASSPTLGTLLYEDTVFFEEQAILNLADGQALIDIDFHFLAGATVSGTIGVSSGTPPANIYVGLTDVKGHQTAIGKVQPPGTYQFVNVPNNTYLVFSYDPTFPEGYSEEFFGGSRSFGTATPVIVSGANQTGKNVTLDPIAHIMGKVTYPGGADGAFSEVFFYPRGSFSPSVFGIADTSGNFDLNLSSHPLGTQGRVLAAGDGALNVLYTFENSTQFGHQGEILTPVSGANPGHDIAGIEPPKISGKITDQASGDGLANVFVSAWDPVEAFRLGSGYFYGVTDVNGDYTIEGVQPGRYSVWASPPFGAAEFHLPEGTPGFFDVPGAVTGKNIALDIGGKIGGTITNSGPVATSVYAYDAACNFAGFAFSAAATGNYLTQALPPGGYHVFAFGTLTLNGKWYGVGGQTCLTSTLVNVTANNTADADIALDDLTGFMASGLVTDSVTFNPLTFASVILENTSDQSFYFALSDACGKFSRPGLPPGTYNISVAKFGYKTEVISNAFTITSSDVTKDVSLDPETGVITGMVTSASQAVQGAQVCTFPLQRCDQTDLAGFYCIANLPPGQYKLVAYTYDGLQLLFYNAKVDLTSADNVTVANNTTTSNINHNLSPVVSDPNEPDVTGTPPVLTERPVKEAGPPRLLPNAPLNRAFRDAEDVDWFRFTATAGLVYRVSITGGAFTAYGFFRGFFDGVTKAADPAGLAQLFSATGWTAPSGGEKWIGLSSVFSAAYTITLTESTPGPPPPTISGINPTSGPALGGTLVTITGTNFLAGLTVKFGGVSATNVVRVNATTITCRTPALPAGTLNDVVVDNPGGAIVVGEVSPHAPAVSATLVKGWLADFLDVPLAFLYHTAIEKIFRAGITTGCGAGNYCPLLPITRDAMAAFILRGEHGGGYVAPNPTGDFFEDVETTTFLARWMEQFGREGITTGCGTAPSGKPNYCPTGFVTRDGMAVFLERGKNGASFLPPAATGNVFCDVTAQTFLARWMEQLKADNITQGCGTGACGKPNYCPLGTVTRGEMAPFIVRTFGL